MATKELNFDGVVSPIGTEAQNVGYTSSSMAGVSNVKQALDRLALQGGGATISTPIYKNNPIPTNKSTLKILAIGNSFTEDPTAYFGRLLAGSGLSEDKVCLYALWIGSGSLELWSGYFDENKANQAIFWRGGTCDTDNTIINGIRSVAPMPSGSEFRYINTNCLTALQADWDIVVVQQVSNYASVFATFNPYLRNIVMHIRRNCTNLAVCIAFQQVWGDTLDARSAAVKQMIAYNGIDVIIPTFAALSNARGTTTFSDIPGNLTRDGHHLGWGVGRYVAACTWWETLVAPALGKSVLGNTATIPAITPADKASTYDGVPVTAENKELCQMCAIAAVTDMYNVTDMSVYEPSLS